jgi:hypothetical protein
MTLNEFTDLGVHQVVIELADSTGFQSIIHTNEHRVEGLKQTFCVSRTSDRKDVRVAGESR